MQRLLIFLFFYSLQVNATGKKNKTPESKKLQIVFCTDLSGSTNGLINDVRNNLWHIINQAQIIAPDAELQLGVVAFSRPSFKKANAYVKILCPLTTDFDFIASELAEIRPSIEKGDQFVGAALRTCVSEMQWSENARKIIYIVGNGMVTDATNDYLRACELAVKNNITVNVIYVVGKNKAKEFTGWNRLAKAGNGLLSEITIGKRDDRSEYTTDFKRMIEAVRDYNMTVVYYSAPGYVSYMKYRSADSLAFTGGNEGLYERAYYKMKNFIPGYHDSWDLVDHHIKTGLMPPYMDTLTVPDSLIGKDNEYIYDLIKVLKSERQRASASLKIVLSGDIPQIHHKKYKGGDMSTENNTFPRAVINMLLKQYP
jgi:hypothetical protein